MTNPSLVITVRRKNVLIARPMLSMAIPFILTPRRWASRDAARVFEAALGVPSPEISMTLRVHVYASANWSKANRIASPGAVSV
jgi:hypothetical protein